MKEIWKDVKGYKKLYQVSNKGRIRSLDKYVGTKGSGKRFMKSNILTICKTKLGYLGIRLSKNSFVKDFRIHRLIASAFISNPNNYPNVCHKDGNSLNNNVENLYWGTQKMNMADKKLHGTWQGGEKNGKAKLNKEKVKIIKHLKTIPNHISRKIIAKIFNISVVTIWEIWSGKTWKHIII